MLSPLPSPLRQSPRLENSPLSPVNTLRRPARLPFGVIPMMDTPVDTPPLQHLDDGYSSNTLASILRAQNYLVMPTKEYRDNKELRECAERLNHGILSEWSYDDLRGVEWKVDNIVTGPDPHQMSNQFVGEIEFEPEGAEEEGGEEENEGPGKKPTPTGRRLSTRSSVKSEPRTPHVEGPRPRGRPHLNLSPESTVERRRAQVRTAQRTYRQRREATISSLEERNRHLEEVLAGMTEAFLILQAAAMRVSDPEKHPGLAAQLQRSTQEFLTLARSAYV